MTSPIWNCSLAFFALLVSNTNAADPPTSTVVIKLSDLQFLVGSWDGYLEYLDYGDNTKRVRLATTIRYEQKTDSINYRTIFTEPNGSKVEDKGGIRPLRDGVKILFDGRSHQVVSKKIDQDAKAYQIVLSNTGKDNNQPATFTTTIFRDKSLLQITKAVKYDGQDESFVRNKYSLKRVE